MTSVLIWILHLWKWTVHWWRDETSADDSVTSVSVLSPSEHQHSPVVSLVLVSVSSCSPAGLRRFSVPSLRSNLSMSTKYCVQSQSSFSGGLEIKVSRVGPIRTSSRTDGWTSAAFRLWTSLWTVAFLPSRRLHWTRPARTAAWILREWSDRQRNTASADRPRSIRTDSHSAPSRDARRDSSWSEGTFWRTESGRRQTSAEWATVKIIIWATDDPNYFRLFLRTSTFSGP